MDYTASLLKSKEKMPKTRLRQTTIDKLTELRLKTRLLNGFYGNPTSDIISQNALCSLKRLLLHLSWIAREHTVLPPIIEARPQSPEHISQAMKALVKPLSGRS
jgi:hypothetical protein